MAETAASPAHKVYNIAHWSDGYISVNGQGEVEICPDRGRSDARINLPALTRSLAEAGVPLPVLIRFTDILHDRVNKLCNAFRSHPSTSSTVTFGTNCSILFGLKSAGGALLTLLFRRFVLIGT